GRNRARRHGFGESVFPEVAHHATPRALAVCEEEGCDRDDFTEFRTFLLQEPGVGFHRAEGIARVPKRENPLVTRPRLVWKRGCHRHLTLADGRGSVREFPAWGHGR